MVTWPSGFVVLALVRLSGLGDVDESVPRVCRPSTGRALHSLLDHPHAVRGAPEVQRSQSHECVGHKKTRLVMNYEPLTDHGPIILINHAEQTHGSENSPSTAPDLDYQPP